MNNKPISVSKAAQTPEQSTWLSRMPLIAGFVAASLIVAYWYAFSALPLNEKPDAWGQFGDYIGGLLNPLISLFTLTVAVSVWRLQGKALEVQKAELEETREAIKAQTLDQFFMGMLSAHRSMVEQVAYLDSSHKELHSGKRAIDTYFRELRSHKPKVDNVFKGSAQGEAPYRAQDPNIYKDLMADLGKKFPLVFDPTVVTAPYICGFCVRYYGRSYKLRDLEFRHPSNHVTFEQAFGHIFRSTYQILKLIDEDFKYDVKKSKRYVNLLRAQMNESEFVFLALSAITEDGQKTWARAIRLNFFEDRLKNSGWTNDLVKLFDPTQENLNKANHFLKNE